VAALHRAGFEVRRQRGSHAILVNAETGRRTVVAMHNRDMSRRALGAIIAQAGLTVEEFLNYL
jgi:mRNA interferase HicA